MRLSLLLLLVLAFPPAWAADIPAPLQAARSAAAGTWQGRSAFAAEGKQESEGFVSDWRETVDRRSGAWRVSVSHPIRSYADGADAKGRWHQDISGGVHPFDSREAQQVAVTEGWLLRMGWLDADDAVYGAPTVDGGLLRVDATAHAGRTVTLWLDRTSGRVTRAQWRSSFFTMTRDFADYRDVGGVALPHRIVTVAKTDSGTEDSNDTVRIDRYAFPDTARIATSLARPPLLPGDVVMRGSAREASTPMTLEGGALLVDVSIDGAKPLPFILDTGGHAILTEATAKALGIKGQGKGVSTGSGPGSMTVAYARVASIALGDAEIHDQTVLVMPFGFSFSDRGDRTPVAGILGLEVFERFAVTFDYDRKQLLLAPFDHGAAPLPGKGTAVPLRFTFDMPLVDGALDGKPGAFGIDTGNSGHLLVFPQWMQRNGLFDRYSKGYALGGGGGVGGAFVSRISHIDSLAIGDVTVHGHVAQLTPPDAGATANVSEAGNIGQDVLSQFLVHVDYRRAAMVLAPRTSKPAGPWNLDPGMRLGRKPERPDRFAVALVVPGSPAAKAGIKPGDAILSVDGVSAAKLGNWGIRDVFNQAKPGQKVVLGMATSRRVTLELSDFAP
ncbi:aspartyl protease family protein [Luteibacter sp. NPDC031894]|uniref:aspartyl protease family protein n=1 Tax=Luteibacter sp. NPDC031894 TaxID=3390572 RepID=UPI003D07D454